jgi:UDP-N-acetylmuramoyl-tripeptide--D-alanyl-D-alanine ligase
MQLREIAKLCGAAGRLNPSLAAGEPTGFAIDSRAVRPGELFVAIPGERVDGHQFVAEVLDKGASAALVTHKRLPFAAELGAYADRLLFVEGTVCAFQRMAARVRAAWNRPIIGVTASAGKTTMKDLTAHVLAASVGAGRVFKSLGNLNTGYGLPLTVGRMIAGGAKPEDFDLAVLEMGMNSYGEIANLADIAPPHVGIVGNVGTAHIEFFGTSDAIAEAKAELVDGLKAGGTAILNADDPRVIRMRERRGDISVLNFGIDSQADVRASAVESEGDLSGTRFTLTTPRGSAAARLPMIGRHNVYNALAAAAAGHHFGLSAEQIAAQLATATASKMRGELLRCDNGVTVIDDSYNSNPQALVEAVRAIAHAHGFRRRVVVAGEMLELGERGPELHRWCGREIAAAGVDWLIGVRGLAQGLVEGARESGQLAADKTSFVETPEAAAEELIRAAREGDLILVKGSRGVRTERVVERLRAAFGAGSAGGV